MQFVIKQNIDPVTQTSDLLVAAITGDALRSKTKHSNPIIALGQRHYGAHNLAKNAGASLLVIDGLNDIKASRLLLVNLGSEKQWDNAAQVAVVKAVVTGLNKSAGKSAHLWLDTASSIDFTSTLQMVSNEAVYSRYRYETTISKKAKPTETINKVTILTTKANAQHARKAVNEGGAVGRGQNISRQLGNLPANICTPSYLANLAKKLGRQSDVITTQVLGEKQMSALKMHSLLSVSAGSKQEAKLIVMRYNGAASAKTKPVVLVGKGVTFDSGGISLKPGGRMDEMKYDMCGAASVFGVMHILDELRPAINVVAIVPATENMPSSQATKPGDVVTSMAGLTIEILNTDAEGRLILCDALTYAAKFKPKSVIDIATLTGACITALGHHHSALYSNNESLAEQINSAGTRSNDSVWRMPMDEAYKKQLKSNFADLANIGGPAAGSVTAACFLSYFAQDYPWAHLDIAGTAWKQGAAKGSTGRPVALLTEYLLHNKK